MVHLRWQVTAALACVCLAVAGPVQACALDGIPSISANGTLAQRITTRPNRANLATWAPFVFPTTYHSGVAVRFTENVTELKRSLLPQAFGHPWHWNFGDGATADGYTVRHSYRHPGAYKLIVSAYYSSYHAWYQFDAALLHIR
jgi:PKD domain-containing protein